MNVEPDTGSIWANSPLPIVWLPGANQKVALRSKLKFSLSPAGTVTAPAGADAGPSRTEGLPQTLAGGDDGAEAGTEVSGVNGAGAEEGELEGAGECLPLAPPLGSLATPEATTC